MVYVLSILVAVAGNLMLLHVVRVATADSTRGLARFLFGNLALTDLLVALIVMPVSLSILYHEGSWAVSDALGKFLCGLFLFTAFAVLTAPTITHLVIAIDRFNAVMFPLDFRKGWRARFMRAKYLVPLIWGVTLLITTPVLIASDFENHVCAFHYENIGLTAEQGQRFLNSYVAVVMYLSPMAATALLYGIIGCKLWSHEVPGLSDKRMRRKSKQKKRDIVKVLLVFVAVFALCWFPAILNHLMMAQSDQNFFPVPTVVFNWIAHTHSAVNPWLLFTLHPGYAAVFRQIRRHRSLSGNLRVPTASPLWSASLRPVEATSFV